MRADADHVIPAFAGMTWVGLASGCCGNDGRGFPARGETGRDASNGTITRGEKER